MKARTVQVGPLGERGIKCDHPRCDGRDAKWQVANTFKSCAVHLARFCEITLRKQPVAVLANGHTGAR